jgi:hypothetical protein
MVLPCCASLHHDSKIHDLLLRAWRPMPAGAIAVMATYPLDLVRTRLAWATEAPAKQQLVAAVNAAGAAAAGRSAPEPHLGIWSILRSTFAEEGVAGLYRGCAPTLLVRATGLVEEVAAQFGVRCLRFCWHQCLSLLYASQFPKG